MGNIHDSSQADQSAIAFAIYVRALLSGQPPNGAAPESFGDYRDLIDNLLTAHAHGGTPAVRSAWRGILRRHPELAELVAGDPDEAKRRTRWTADELLAAQFPPIRWIIPDFFPEGLTFLAGRPKIGKSLLALQMAHAVSSGGKIFGQDLIKAPVLYLAFEDSARRLQRRMQEQAWPAYSQAVFCTAWDPLDQGGLVTLQQAMVEEGYRLVIIDTLSRALSAKPDQNNVSDMTTVLSTLQRLALDRQALIQVIDHHHKVQGAQPDPVDDILGSTGKGAVADCVAGLYRERGKKGAVLHITGRDLDGDKRLALEWDVRLACWNYLGNADEVAKDTVQAAILEAVEALGGCATTAEIADYLRKSKQQVNHEILELAQKGRLLVGKKDGKTQPYYLPGWVPPGEKVC
jgi:AAA domain